MFESLMFIYRTCKTSVDIYTVSAVAVGELEKNTFILNKNHSY